VIALGTVFKTFFELGAGITVSVFLFGVLPTLFVLKKIRRW
jgi:hypothetical protein